MFITGTQKKYNVLRTANTPSIPTLNRELLCSYHDAQIQASHPPTITLPRQETH